MEKKIEMILTKGKLNLSRPPRIALAGQQIKLIREFNYLGLTIKYGIEGIKAGRHLEIVNASVTDL